MKILPIGQVFYLNALGKGLNNSTRIFPIFRLQLDTVNFYVFKFGSLYLSYLISFQVFFRFL